MKVISLLFLTAAVASAARSGPYLPSGWKPDGPAFLLPGETGAAPQSGADAQAGLAPRAGVAPDDEAQKSDNPLKESLQVEPDVESEAESSDLFREYGPPKLTANQVTVQDLPAEVTETAFANLRSNVGDESSTPADDKVTGDDKPVTENDKPATGDEEASGDGAADDEKPEGDAGKTEELASRSGNLESETTEASSDATDKTDSATESKVTDATEGQTDVTEAKTDATEGSTTEGTTPEGKSANIELENEADNSDVDNIQSKFGNDDVAADLEKLENEIKDGQASTEAAPETKPTDSADAKNADVPEGFLEYGPPGFKEYGPPKEDVKDEEKPAEVETEESNEARRRFSPKFSKAKRPSKRH